MTFAVLPSREKTQRKKYSGAWQGNGELVTKRAKIILGQIEILPYLPVLASSLLPVFGCMYIPQKIDFLHHCK